VSLTLNPVFLEQKATWNQGNSKGQSGELEHIILQAVKLQQEKNEKIRYIVPS
jgi:hypothetical protein